MILFKKNNKLILIYLLLFCIITKQNVMANDHYSYINQLFDTVNEFYIYKTENIEALEPAKEQTKITVNLLEFKKMLKTIKYKDGEPLRKGSYIGVIKLINGTEKKMLISQYDSFFEIINNKGFYYFEGKEQKRWNEIVSQLKDNQT